MSIVTTFQRKHWNESLLDLREKYRKLLAGSICGIWGAGAKGATFCNIVDPDCEIFSFVVDLTPEKIGKFIPGTGHRIVSYESLRNVKTVLLMNPNYREENQMLLDEAGIKTRLVDV